MRNYIHFPITDHDREQMANLTDEYLMHMSSSEWAGLSAFKAREELNIRGYVLIEGQEVKFRFGGKYKKPTRWLKLQEAIADMI